MRMNHNIHSHFPTHSLSYFGVVDIYKIYNLTQIAYK